MRAAEVGPEDVGDDDLGVADLPEEEIRDAAFAAGADEQIESHTTPFAAASAWSFCMLPEP